MVVKKARTHEEDLERCPKLQVWVSTVFLLFLLVPTPRTGSDGVSLFDPPPVLHIQEFIEV